MENFRVSIKKRNKGFTLIELLVSFFLFIIIIGGMTSSMLQGLKVQQRMIANQRMLDEANFLMDRMSRNLKFGKNYELLDESKPGTIYFDGFKGEDKTISFYSRQEYIEEDHEKRISSENVRIRNLVFFITSKNSPAQKVAILMTVQSEETGDEVTVQTVVSPFKDNVWIPES